MNRRLDLINMMESSQWTYHLLVSAYILFAMLTEQFQQKSILIRICEADCGEARWGHILTLRCALQPLVEALCSAAHATPLCFPTSSLEESFQNHIMCMLNNDRRWTAIENDRDACSLCNIFSFPDWTLSPQSCLAEPPEGLSHALWNLPAARRRQGWKRIHHPDCKAAHIAFTHPTLTLYPSAVVYLLDLSLPLRRGLPWGIGYLTATQYTH